MNGWRQRILIVCAKETMDNLRDRRSLLVALIYPLMGPLLLGLMMSIVASVIGANGSDGKAKKIPLYVEGAANGQALISFLEAQGAVLLPAPIDVKEAVRSGSIDIALVIAGDFSARFDEKRTAAVQVITNTSRLPGLMALNRLADYLGNFNRQIWAARLAERGVDFDVLRPISIDSVNTSGGAQITDILLFMAPPLIIFNVFMGGVYLAIDTTSGERERGSLEPLLINPIERWGLMLGKFLAALLFTAAAVLVQLLAFKAVFMAMGGADSIFARILTLQAFLGAFLTLAPLMMLAVSVQFIIATFTRSFKEAQTYLGLLPLAPALPGLVMVFSPVQAQSWMMAIPTFSQTLLLGQALRGEPMLAFNMALSISSTTALSLALIFIAAGLYEREKLIFGG